ncbi:hypothetical protein Y032_0108g68 [Ancylostoma ceylanicum]|uniref:Uncharacterized protein n=1 Tax=Ancylostoma ceylanicum TaxID=53326 RepID=A0A016TF88_9BILA|nr:hypothetical protein Y032_0108g68 [Ancylostoma ceylanicum]
MLRQRELRCEDAGRAVRCYVKSPPIIDAIMWSVVGSVWRSGKRLAALAHGLWFDPAHGQTSHPSGVGELVPEETRMKH